MKQICRSYIPTSDIVILLLLENCNFPGSIRKGEVLSHIVDKGDIRISNKIGELIRVRLVGFKELSILGLEQCGGLGCWN